MEEGVTVEKRLETLRHELKKYETAFKAKHGRKAEREEIKNDASIWRKYGEYRDLQRQLSKPQRPSEDRIKAHNEQHEREVLKELPANMPASTPQKREKTVDKLQVQAPVPAEVEQTPACVRCALGPTPQKDGEVLGIFDMLPAGTPSKGSAPNVTNAISVVGATPTKPTASTTSAAVLARTPQSSGKRFYLDAFAGTPLKRKLEEDIYTPNAAKQQYTTPSFLRRILPMESLDEENREPAISAPPFKKHGLVRSLSTIIQGLKKQEEERMDDDWDILNELEADERGGTAPPAGPKVLVEESQAVEMPLGPDQGVESSEDDAGDPGALDANGNPRKVWKKKGLKRQTRRVIMRPVTHKPGKEVDADLSNAEENGVDAVGETQLGDAAAADEGNDDAEDSDKKHDSQQSEHQTRPGNAKKAKAGKDKEKSSTTTGKKTAANSVAHANFRRLKIKNKNSKANGRGRKFGRR